MLDFSGLIALAAVDPLCGSMSTMVLPMESMSSSYCSVSNRFLNSSWNLIIFDLICVISTFGGLLVISFSFPPLRLV